MSWDKAHNRNHGVCHGIKALKRAKAHHRDAAVSSIEYFWLVPVLSRQQHCRSYFLLHRKAVYLGGESVAAAHVQLQGAAQLLTASSLPAKSTLGHCSYTFNVSSS